MDNTIMDNTKMDNTIIHNTIKPNRNPWDSVWADTTIKDSFILHKTDGSILHIKKGDWVKIPGRDDVVIIDSIVDSITDSIITLDLTKQANQANQANAENNTGPRGITYLPWRYDEQRFATPAWSIKGNTRFIICYPSGKNHYGIHIDWDKFELCSAPDNIKVEMVNEILGNVL